MGTQNGMDLRDNQTDYVMIAARHAPVVTGGSSRWLVAISLAAGALYPAIDGRFGSIVDISAKGLGVAALALAAALVPGHRWLAAIMAAGALGDVLLELQGAFIAGAGAFAMGHIIAMVFYVRNRRAGLPTFDRLIAAAIIGYGLAMPSLVMPTGAPVGLLMLYSVLLCGMAAAAFISRFPRHWTALGALLFVVSDTLLVMRLGGRLLGGAMLHGLMVWYFYYFGQLGVFIGVSRGLARHD